MSGALTEIKASFFKLHQKRKMKLEKYHELFQVQVDVLNEIRITIEEKCVVNLTVQAGQR